jgi:hypothetical protein
MLAKTLPREGGVISFINLILFNYRSILAYEYNPIVFFK